MYRVARPLRHKSTGPILTALALSGALAIRIVPLAHAQALDDQVEFLLSNQCAGLGFFSSSDSFGKEPDFGENLSRICFAAQGDGSSLGGGAASPQASALSVEASLLQQRLERARDKKKKEGSSSAAASKVCRDRSEGVCLASSADEDDAMGSISTDHRLNFFATGTFGDLDRSATPFEDGYDSTVKGGALGVDYQFSHAVVAGLVAGYREQDADFSGGGDFELKAFEPAVYLSILPSPKTFLQFAVGYGGEESDVNRRVNFSIIGGNPLTDGSAASSVQAGRLSSSAQFGLDFSTGRFTFGPRLGVNYNWAEINSYFETGGTGLELLVQERTIRSLQGVLGFYGAGAFSTKSCVIVPQFNVEYIHEFEDDPSIVNAQFAEDLRGPDAVSFVYQTSFPDTDFGNVDAGVGFVFAHGIQLFVNIRALVGHDNLDSVIGTLGARFEL